MVDKDVLFEKTNRIQNGLARIHDTMRRHSDRMTDFDVQDVIVLNLQRAIQLSLDMASYLIGTERMGVPSTFKDCFAILEKNQILPHDLSQKMQKMIEFRNIDVHDYQAIDLRILQKILTHHLKDFEDFYSTIIQKFCINRSS